MHIWILLIHELVFSQIPPQLKHSLLCESHLFRFQDFACIFWLVFSLTYYFHFSAQNLTLHFIIQSHSIMRAFHNSSQSAFVFITMNNSASSANLVASIITLFSRSFKNMLNNTGPCGTLSMTSLYCNKIEHFFCPSFNIFYSSSINI